GVFEGTEQRVITEIRTKTPNYSYVDYYGSTLTAAGALSMFDGPTNVPAILETPRDVTLWPEPSPAVDGGTAEFIPEEHQMFLEDGSAVDFKGVFVFIDRNGIKYRSAPFDIGKIVNDSGANQYYAPVIDFKLSESLSA